MKTLTGIFMSALIFISLNLQAQPQAKGNREARQEKIEALKVSFITRQLDLSVEEAQQFWPVYNEFQKALGTIRKQRFEDRKKLKAGIEEMSDAEISKILDNTFDLEQQELDIKKTHFSKMKKVLPVIKVAKLYKAEDDFRRHVLQEAQNRKRESGTQERQ